MRRKIKRLRVGGAAGREYDQPTATAQAAAASAASAASSSGGGTVKVTNNDTTPLPLFDKLEPGFGLNKTLINAGANEKISLTSDSIIYAIALG